jgi:pSer/pThr/pTyr-binding forkhead associated (FHA) protein/DNA-directed RNA polymerase subunit RPC12/RpoP
MIDSKFQLAEHSRQRHERKGTGRMESLTSGTMAGAGSFRCQRCGYVLTLTSLDMLGECPGCGGHSFARASLFSAAPRPLDTQGSLDTVPAAPAPPLEEEQEREGRLVSTMAELDRPGEYLLFEEDGEMRTVALTREWTRIGRSLAADVRFDDPTVSRRHALVVRQADGVRVLDDRSLNGVFVNGERVEWRALSHGDEIVVGRYRLRFVSLTDSATADGLGLGSVPAAEPLA